MDAWQKRIIRAIQESREMRKLSKKECAVWLGCDPSYWCLVEQMQRTPSYKIMEGMCQIVGLELLPPVAKQMPRHWGEKQGAPPAGDP